jgi:hypothetical protein
MELDLPTGIGRKVVPSLPGRIDCFDRSLNLGPLLRYFLLACASVPTLILITRLLLLWLVPGRA